MQAHHREKWKILFWVGQMIGSIFLETGFAHETGNWDGEAPHISLKVPPC